MQAYRPEIQAAISRHSEAFAKMGFCAAEELELALAAESVGGARPATPIVDMIKHAASAVECVEERVARAVQEEALALASNGVLDLAAMSHSELFKGVKNTAKVMSEEGVVASEIKNIAATEATKSSIKAGTVSRETFESSIDTLLNAGNALDRNYLTRAGRALQKHGGRIDSVFSKSMGNAAEINKQGAKVLQEILSDKRTIAEIEYYARYGNVLECRLPDGRGARFSADGKVFIGFLEPNKIGSQS